MIFTKKKTIYLIGLAIVLLFLIITYFKPLSFSDTVGTNNLINMVLNEFEVKDGEPDGEFILYQDIAAEQSSAILNILENYTYRRTFGTLFSSNSISNLGEKMLTIYVYDDNSSVEVIVVTSSGRVVANDKSYCMNNADQIIEQLIEIME